MADRMNDKTARLRDIEKVHNSMVVKTFSSVNGDIFYVLANGESGTWRAHAEPEATA